ncbi:hypothetical protein PENTCL1PPCAC_11916, partial [Pristionchus entomophagus]
SRCSPLFSMDLDVIELEQIPENDQLTIYVKKGRWIYLIIVTIITFTLVSTAYGIDHWGTDNNGNHRGITAILPEYGANQEGFTFLGFLANILIVYRDKVMKMFGLFVAYIQVLEISLLWLLLGLWSSLGGHDDYSFGPSFFITIATILWILLQMPLCGYLFVIFELMRKK